MIHAIFSEVKLRIIIDGNRSHLDCKALGALLGKVNGRGQYSQIINGQLVELCVDNETTTSEHHEAISER